ncbi:hypothetical protein [Amycolatopsis plumensis]|uniref:Ricin B lectin domain-containing protein n=1 Tax=Amycolatopsis plumensis TaxID=236508 RepID=A0ABV5TWJ1_9PSEU
MATLPNHESGPPTTNSPLIWLPLTIRGTSGLAIGVSSTASGAPVAQLGGTGAANQVWTIP